VRLGRLIDHISMAMQNGMFDLTLFFVASHALVVDAP
jgi:hypothetical protein